MLNATCFDRFKYGKKKLKTILDFPILLKQLAPRPLPQSKKQVSITPSKKPEQKAPEIIQTTINRPIGSPSKTNSTRAIRKSIIRIKPQSEKEKEDVSISHGNESFTEGELLAIWNTYVQKMKLTSGGFTSSILVNCEPILKKDNQTIHLIFRNETNEIEFNKLSFDLLEHLKFELKNDHINFSTEVNKAKAKKTLYTNKEKFDHLAEKHPELNDWLQKLGLELK